MRSRLPDQIAGRPPNYILVLGAGDDFARCFVLDATTFTFRVTCGRATGHFGGPVRMRFCFWGGPS